MSEMNAGVYTAGAAWQGSVVPSQRPRQSRLADLSINVVALVIIMTIITWLQTTSDCNYFLPLPLANAILTKLCNVGLHVC